MRSEVSKNRVQRRWWWLGGGLLAGAGLLASGLAVARHLAVVRAEPISAAPARHAGASVGCMGRVEPASRVRRLAPPESQGPVTLTGLTVSEGDHVEREQLLGWFSGREVRAAELRQAEAQLGRSEATLAQVEAGAKAGDVSAAEARVARQRAAEANARVELDRVVKLSTEKVAAATELDSRRTTLAVAEAERRAAEQELASVGEVRRVDVTVAQADVVQAHAAVQRAGAELALAELRAPMGGTVLTIYTWPGERIDEHGVLDLADLGEMHVVAEVYETDVPRVRIGQPAAVILPGGDERLHGEVIAMGWQVRKREVINTDPVDEIDSRVVEARIRIDAAGAARLARFSHMRVQVVIGG
jgi:HlyD family secretion protein